MPRGPSKKSGGASKKTNPKQRVKPRAKAPKKAAGTSKKTTTKQRAKPQAKVPKQGSSKRTTSKQRAKPQAKVPKQSTSKKTTTKQRAKPQAKVPKQVNPGALKTTSTMQRTTLPTIVNHNVTNVYSPPPPVKVQLIPFNQQAYNYDQEGPSRKRKEMQSQSSPGSKLAYEAYAQEGPAPKRMKVTFKEGKPSDLELDDLAGKIASVWKKLGIQLGIKQHVLEEIEANADDKPLQMLLRWKNTTSSDTPYRDLYEALCSDRIGLNNLAKEFCCTETT